MLVELGVAIAQADIEIAAKTAVSEGAILEIRAGALESVGLVAVETAAAVVAAIGGVADPKAISAAVAKQVKG
jgi:F-type H+-transporting ATPase subunit b